MAFSKGTMVHVMREMFRRGTRRIPSRPLPVQRFIPSDYSVDYAGGRVTWLGHSSVLLELQGVVFLIDPVFGDRVSPVPFAGARRFPWKQPLLLGSLPKVDVLIISHDHYDHLERATVKKLHGNVRRIITTRGVDERLRRWGVPAEKITALDWWQETQDISGTTITAVPTRHFSGRTFMDRFSTLWAGFAIRGDGCNVLFGSDSGYFPGFEEIGRRLGPFDLAMLECGQYNEHWSTIHMMPEETAQAAVDLGARVLLPIHWGAFSLSPHDWDEPVRRLLLRAKTLGVTVATPMLGQRFDIHGSLPVARWWEGN